MTNIPSLVEDGTVREINSSRPSVDVECVGEVERDSSTRSRELLGRAAAGSDHEEAVIGVCHVEIARRVVEFEAKRPPAYLFLVRVLRAVTVSCP